MLSRRESNHITLRGGSGLGDSIYVQSIARYFVQRGKQVTVNTNWPDVFRPLTAAKQVQLAPFSRRATHLAHYTLRKHNAGTTQFQDCCIAAGVRDPVELDLGWQTVNPNWKEQLRQRADGRPVVAVQLPRHPMNRPDGFGAELLPKCSIFAEWMTQANSRVFFVLVGSGKSLYNLSPDWDLSNQTSVADLIDIVQACDGCLGYVSFIVPLAESLNKPMFCLWSRAGLKVANKYVNSITPQKILHKPTDSFVIDDESEETRRMRFDNFLGQVSAAAGLRGQTGGDSWQRPWGFG